MEQKAQAEKDYAAFCCQLPADRDPETDVLWKVTLEDIYEDFCQMVYLQQHPKGLADLPDGWPEEAAL